jgi:parallel beta-helix repeat protein
MRIDCFILALVLAISILPFCHADNPMASDGAMFHKYLSHTAWDGVSYTPVPGINQANFSIGSTTWQSSPAVANGYVYVGNYDGTVYQLNASNISIANTSPPSNVSFSQPTPASNVNDFIYPITFNMTSASAMSTPGYIEIDGTNQTCILAADNLSCSYALPYDSTLFNHTYSAKGYADINGTYYLTDETRTVPYYGCGNVDASGTLLGNVSINGSTCFTIIADNVDFNGNGYTVSGNSSNATYLPDFGLNQLDPRSGGIYANAESLGDGHAWRNETLSNFRIANFIDGIYLDTIFNSTVINDTCYNNVGAGIDLDGDGYNITFVNNTAYGNLGSGFNLPGDSSANNTIAGNLAYGNFCGFNLNSNSFYSVTGNTAHDNYAYGFYSYMDDDMVFSGNIAYNQYGFCICAGDGTPLSCNTTAASPGYVLPDDEYYMPNDGFYIVDYDDLFINNTAYNNTNGFSLDGDNYNVTLIGNFAYNNSNGFYSDYNGNISFTNSSYNDYSDTISFINNSAYGNQQDGFVLDSETNDTLRGNSAYNNSGSGFYIFGETLPSVSCPDCFASSSTYNSLTNNSAYGNGLYGFRLGVNSSNNNLTGNVAYNNTAYQIYLSGASSNLIYDNAFNASRRQGVAYDDNNTNSWNTTKSCAAKNIVGGNCTGGNWYSNYAGIDLNRDGIGETATYAIGPNTDYLPLTNKLTGAASAPSTASNNNKEQMSWSISFNCSSGKLAATNSNGIAGIDVRLFGTQSAYSGTGQSDSSGTVSFIVSESGSYRIDQPAMDGYLQYASDALDLALCPNQPPANSTQPTTAVTSVNQTSNNQTANQNQTVAQNETPIQNQTPSGPTPGDASAAISAANSAIGQAMAEGKNVTGAQDLINGANAAFANGNFASAVQLAQQAGRLALNATAPQTNQASNADSTAAKGPNWPWIAWALVLVAITIGGYYYLLAKNGKRKWSK